MIDLEKLTSAVSLQNEVLLGILDAFSGRAFDAEDRTNMRKTLRAVRTMLETATPFEILTGQQVNLVDHATNRTQVAVFHGCRYVRASNGKTVWSSGMPTQPMAPNSLVLYFERMGVPFVNVEPKLP